MMTFASQQLDLLKGYEDEKGRDLRIALIETYLAETESTLPLLGGLPHDELKRKAHTLKSSSAAVGGVSLSEMFRRIETEDLNPHQISQILSEAPSEYRKLKIELQSYLKNILV